MADDDIRRWTPIQEGRFHLLNRKPGESLKNYVHRIYPGPMSPAERLNKQAQVRRTLALAYRERNDAQKKGRPGH